jgi:hypothetical protein
MARIGLFGRPWLGGDGPPASNPRRRWRTRVRLAAIPSLSLVLLFAMAGQASAAGTLLKISSDPYTGSGTSGQHATQVEPDSLSAGNTIVSAFQSGRVFNGGASNIGFATSHDGGRTFVQGFLPGTTIQATPSNPAYQRASDVSVAFDARDNVWILSYLLLPPFPIPGSPPFVDVFASRSTDGGLTWGLPVVIAKTGDFFDKNWSVCDNTATSPFFGNCYTEYDDASLGDLEQMSTSHNGGLTWDPGKPTADGAHGIGGQPLVQPNGHVVVPYVGLDSPIFLFTENAFISVDGGASWSAGNANQIAPAVWAPPAGGIRATIPLPSAEIDQSGKVYVAWSDCRFRSHCALGNVTSDIVFSTSSDGTTWSPVTRIPSDPVASTVDHFIPGLAVDKSTAGSKAHLAVAYYFYPNGNCTVTSCRLAVGFSSSTNGGKTWTTGETLSSGMHLAWLAPTSQGPMVGDYISTSIVNGARTASPFFAVARANSGSVFDEATFTSVGLSIRGGSAASGNDPVLSAPISSANLGAAVAGVSVSTTRFAPTDY